MSILTVVSRGDQETNLHLITLRTHAYANILKILQPKIENFQIKNSDIFFFFFFFFFFSYFSSKHRLWVLVNTASARRF